MNFNFTLYGPVHSGKSTLAGLMITRGKSPEELERMDRRIMEELGNEYDPSQRIAYYVDTAQDERRRDNRVNSIGTSKHLHYQKVSLGEGGGEILLIDSPGSKIRWKQSYRSSFLADIGVLVYDIASFRKLVNMEKDSSAYRKEKKNLLSHIKIWKNYKNLNYLIIAISKMDEETEKNISFGGYNRILFANAITIIKSNPELQKIPIVPISIDVRNYKEHNIFTESLEMRWYSGKTLMETIKEKIEYFCKNDMSAPYTFANVVQKLRIKETKETVFRIKVLSGEVRKGDILQITQVAENKVSDYAMGEVRVKSLKSDQGKKTDIFVKGMIGGVTLSKIKINGKVASAEDLQLSRASYLVGCETKIKTGNILCLKSEKNPQEFYNFNMRDKVNLLMFGKIISTILVGKYRKDDGVYLYVYTKNYPLALF